MKRPSSLRSGSLLLILLACYLAGCLPGVNSGGLTRRQNTPYVPPTPAELRSVDTAGASYLATPTATGNAPLPANQPTATAQCRDNLAFLKDISIPDGTVVAPDSTLDKRWEVENKGNCNWTQGYRIRLIAGPELGAQKEQALYPARSGSPATLRIVFKAPLEPGTYRSAWQAFNPQGEPFGDPFFIEIKVETP